MIAVINAEIAGKLRQIRVKLDSFKEAEAYRRDFQSVFKDRVDLVTPQVVNQ